MAADTEGPLAAKQARAQAARDLKDVREEREHRVQNLLDDLAELRRYGQLGLDIERGMRPKG